jgi:saccharopine dehydrogenase-like NADP-dependent oxidoreductase
MKTILIVGAGKSSTFLIDYFLNHDQAKNRKLILADVSISQAHQKLKNRPYAEACAIDLENPQSRISLIQKADVVVSMLPAHLHPIIAEDCILLRKHFFTASYESDFLKSKADEILHHQLLFLNECGLDPGLDHMSAMKIIDEEKAKGNKIISFKSYCGGLLDLESENNPWKYKFTWNPRNVVLAGQGTSRYISKGNLKLVPYHQLFKRTENITFEAVGEFEGYPNRDSLIYRKTYGIENIPTLLRGTLRRKGFCRAWDFFVQIGMTEDTYTLSLPDQFTPIQFLQSFLPENEEKDIKKSIVHYFPSADQDLFDKLDWLGFFEEKPLPFKAASPAQLLQYILEEKWVLEPTDKDMIVMQHQFEVLEKNRLKKITSSLVCSGLNQEYTAMAKTVGLPLAITLDLFLEGKISLIGLHLPVLPEIYQPVLERLEKMGIIFSEKVEYV